MTLLVGVAFTPSATQPLKLAAAELIRKCHSHNLGSTLAPSDVEDGDDVVAGDALDGPGDDLLDLPLLLLFVVRRALTILVFVLGCNLIDIFVGPESGPEPGPSHVISLETCLKLKCPSTECGPEFVPVWHPVLRPKFKVSIELHPRSRPTYRGSRWRTRTTAATASTGGAWRRASTSASGT